jgi:uncharacterized integral membrane protein
MRRRGEADGMQFLKTLFWVLVTALVLLFSFRNWAPVTISLWDDIQADVKIPVLLLIFFLLGFLPTWLWMRAKVWTHRRRIDALERTRAATTPAPVEESEAVE